MYISVLVDIFINLQDSETHKYIEVVLRRHLRGEKKEGNFIENATANHESTIGDVERLG